MSNLTAPIYGNAPKSLGIHDFPTGEMMFWLYCPVRLPSTLLMYSLPDNLKQYEALLDAVRQDVINDFGIERWADSYVYLTAKTLYVSETSPGNRMGWHSDGFMTDDLNYIWADRNPTLFCTLEPLQAFTANHSIALAEMEGICNSPLAEFGEQHITYHDRSLLRLDQTVLHAVNPTVEAGLRTFLKVSISDKPYALKGNSINHLLPQHPRPEEKRQVERNHPQGN